GLSFDDVSTAAEACLLLVAGSTYAWLVSLLWPERDAAARAASPAPDRRSMLGYGLLLGVAAAIGYLIASGLELDHPGWAPAACLLVARPQLDLMQLRGVGRVVAVLVGATAAALVLRLDPPDLAYAVLAVAVLAAAAATTGSRWYITPGFATFFVFVLLLHCDPAQSAHHF